MPGKKPKVLFPVGGRPMIQRVMKTAAAIGAEKTVVVVGYEAEQVRRAIEGYDAAVVVQEPQLGTGHAVSMARDELNGFEGSCLILYGDVPLLSRESILMLLQIHEVEENDLTVLTAIPADPGGYGRIQRDERGRCVGIVEEADLDTEGQNGREVNTGIMVIEARHLFEHLDRLRPLNEQSEYYLTDLVASFAGSGLRVGTVVAVDAEEAQGINTLEQLAAAERVLETRGAFGCPYCRLAQQGDKSALILERSGEWLVRVPSPGFNSGHVVIHPRRHVVSMAALKPAERETLAPLIATWESRIRKEYSPEAVNIGATSRDSGHLVIHLIPRWRGDVNYLPLVSGLKLVPEKPLRTWERLKG